MFNVQNYDKAKRTVTEINTALQGKVNKNKIFEILSLLEEHTFKREKERKKRKKEAQISKIPYSEHFYTPATIRNGFLIKFQLAKP